MRNKRLHRGVGPPSRRIASGLQGDNALGANDILKVLEAEFVRERVVQDRNRFTGGGVTAGIDFGLTAAAELKDEQYAKWIQLVMEYAPAPPFKSGTPAEAGEAITKMTEAMFAIFTLSAITAAEKAKAGW